MITHGEGLSPEQAVGTCFCEEYAEASDGQWKAFSLPYPQAVDQMRREWLSLAADKPPALDGHDATRAVLRRQPQPPQDLAVATRKIRGQPTG